MSAFNKVRGFVTCPSCGSQVEVVAQFKFGDTWQHEYSIGDPLKWGGNQIGKPGARRVIVEAAAEKCPNCDYEGEWALYLIVENDRLAALEQASGKYDFSKLGVSYVVEEA